MGTLQKPGLGMNSWLGFGEESSYGTASTRTNFLEIESETLMKEVNRIEAVSILRRGVVDNKVLSGAVHVMGDMSFPVQYDGWMPLLKHAFGAVAHSQPDVTNAPTVYKHHFTIEDVLPTGLTFEVFRDTTQFTTEPNKSFVYTGCKIEKIELHCAVDEVLRCNVSIMGQDEARATRSSSNPTFSSAPYVIFTQGILTYNSNDMEVNNVALSLNNGLAPRFKLGSALTREPVADAKIVASGSFECEFTSWNEYDDFVNTTERSLTLNFTGPSIAGGQTYKMNFTCTQIFIDKVKLSLDRPGRILMTIDFKCYRNSASTINEIIADVYNINATI